MKLVNVTNSHARLVRNQLENTDAQFVKVYSVGNTTVVYSEASGHSEILLVNKKRNILPKEIDFVRTYFLNKMSDDTYHHDKIVTIEMPGIAEISIPKKSSPTVT